MSKTFKEQMKEEWFKGSPAYRLMFTILVSFSLAIIGFLILNDTIDVLVEKKEEGIPGLLILALALYVGIMLLYKPIIRVAEKANPELCEWLKEKEKPYELALENKKKDPDYPRKRKLDLVFECYALLMLICFIIVTVACTTWAVGPFKWSSYTMLAVSIMAIMAFLSGLLLRHADRINKRYGRKVEIIEGHREVYLKERRAVLFRTAFFYIGLCGCAVLVMAILVELGIVTEMDANTITMIALAHWVILFVTAIGCAVWAQALSAHTQVVWEEDPEDPSLAFAAYLFDKKRD